MYEKGRNFTICRGIRIWVCFNSVGPAIGGEERAQRMVDDHSKANDELMQLATTKGMAVPKEMKKIHRDMIDKLSKSSGAAFDKAYVDEMVKDHVKDVSAFRKEAKEGKDPEVKAWASKTLPTLEDHLKMVRDLSKKEMGKKEPAKKK
jgi:putative membrane protein